MRNLFSMLVLLTLPLTAGDFLQDSRDAINRIKPFRVNFVQQVLVDGETEIEESGEILFKDITRLKWTYLNPDFKVFVMEGQSYRFYDRENNQLIKGKLTVKNRQWIWQLLFAPEAEKAIQVDENQRRIHFRDDEEDLDIEIILDENLLPLKAVQKDFSGIEYRYLFSGYQKGVSVAPEDFNIRLPADAEIIDGSLE